MAARVQEGHAYRLRVAPDRRAYIWVIREATPTAVQVSRGWFSWETDGWELSREVRQVPLERFLAAPHLGPAPSPGEHRASFSWAPVGAGPPPADSPRKWVLTVGQDIARTSLHEWYGGNTQGGISSPRDSSEILVFTDPATGRQHGYMDRWDGEVLHYYGEGQSGDQEIRAGNRAIATHHETGKTLRVFQGSSGVVRYLGEFEADPEEPYYWAEAPSTGGGALRRAVVFRLRPLPYDALATPEVKGVGLSTPYRAPRRTPTTGYRDPIRVDPDAVDRANDAHIELERSLERAARAVGADTFSPGALDPEFDVAWRYEGLVYVAEVKSLTVRNETTQLRLGLGQVLHYRYLMDPQQVGAVKAVLFVERRPTDERWSDICAKQGVTLSWPDRLEQFGVPG